MSWGSRDLMDRALDLKPEITQSCGFESRLWQEASTTEVRPLSKAPNPWVLQCRLPTAPGVCALGWVKCRAHIILCIIVYVTNRAYYVCLVNNAGVLLLDIGEYKSPNFLQTSEPLRTQWISL